MDKELEMVFVDKSKTQADGTKYFALFDKHIPSGLGLGTRVMLYALGNLDCILKIIEKNPVAEYIVSDSAVMSKVLPLVTKSRVKFVPFSLDGYNILEKYNMKFDCIVMNPPYQRNLHLKILAEALKHLKDEKSVCVNLSPVRWLQDPLAKYKKHCDSKRFEESVAKHIESLEVYDGDVISKVFSGGLPTSAIYVLDKTKYDKYKELLICPLVDKVIAKVGFGCPEFDKDKKDGWRVKVSPIYGGGTAGNHSNGKETLRNIGKLLVFKDGLREGKPWHTFYAHNGATKIQDKLPFSLKFISEIEAKNFCKQYSTSFCKVYTHLVKRGVNVSPMTILWLGDVTNPRTGLVGYKGEWTDDDLYKFFNITPEEQKIIEETMEKYK